MAGQVIIKIITVIKDEIGIGDPFSPLYNTFREGRGPRLGGSGVHFFISGMD